MTDELLKAVCDWIAEGAGLAKRRVVIAKRDGGGGKIIAPYMSVLEMDERVVMGAQRVDGIDATVVTDLSVQSYFDEGAATRLKVWAESDHAAALSDASGFRLVGEIEFRNITVPDADGDGDGDYSGFQVRRAAIFKVGYITEVDVDTVYIENIPFASAGGEYTVTVDGYDVTEGQ